MLTKLKKQPLLMSMLIVFLYALWFVIPALLHGIDPHAHGLSGIGGALSMWRSELITAVVLILLVSWLGWWRQIGFKSVAKGGWKFLFPILLIALVFLNMAWVIDTSGKWFMGFSSPIELFSLIGVVLLLGFVEEGIFRGVLFYGLRTKLTPLFTVILTAVIFGLFHFVNLIEGATFDQTLFQALHAGAMGFLYASLRLHLDAVWPLMLTHSFWDFSLFTLQSAHHTEAVVEGSMPLSLGFMIAAPALLYGVFVYWRWRKSIRIAA